MTQEPKKYHHFLDEAGDTTFFGKGRLPMLGKDGVSQYFSLGLCWFNEPLQPIRKRIIELENEVSTNPYYKVGSVLKKINQTGKFYFHATDDIPEIRKLKSLSKNTTETRKNYMPICYRIYCTIN